MAKRGWLKLSKRDWYAQGGFANPKLFRRADKRGVWSYWKYLD